MQLSSDEKLLTQGNLGRALRVLAVPMALEMVMEAVFSVADVLFVARLGSASVAAVGLTESLMMVVYAIAFGVAIATTALVSRRTGEGDEAGAARAAAQAIAFGSALSMVIAVIGTSWAEPLLRLQGASPEVAEVGRSFASISFAGNLTILLLFIQNGAFRGVGAAKIAMVSLTLANLCNLILDPCLIFGLGPFPELGLEGAAWATLIGRGIGVVFQWYLFTRPSSGLKLALPHFVPDKRTLRSITRLTIGASAQQFVEVASWIWLMRLLANFGESALAGYAIAIRLLSFPLLLAWGISNAATTLVGQNLGAGKPERAEQAVWLAMGYCGVFLALAALCLVPASQPLMELVGSDPKAVEVGANALRIIGYGFVFYGCGTTAVQALNGAGDTATPGWLNLIALWGVKLPLAYFFAEYSELGTNGIFWAITIAYVLHSVGGILLFRLGRWKSREL